MSVDALKAAIDADVASKRTPIAVVATAGTVNTGAIDPLKDIAEICRRNNLWLHVDGAYGALAAMARPEQFAGLALADSISLDPHKWLYQPVDCGCLLYRRADDARRAFLNTGDYAKSLDDDPTERFAFFDESLELSRRFRALRLWLSIRYHGLGAFRESILHNLKLAQRLEQLVQQQQALELLAPVQLSAVCFRVRGEGLAGHSGMSQQGLNELNQRILHRINQRGRVYLSNATLNGNFALRACITNHRTTEADVSEVIAEVVRASELA
jgi:glutamate/tyrosine decarboxylase-like PLP-dependent enzyme